jgi:hypothetical protein
MSKFFLNLGQIAAKLGVSREILNGMLESNLIETVTVNRRRYVTVAALNKFISDSTGK